MPMTRTWLCAMLGIAALASCSRAHSPPYLLLKFCDADAGASQVVFGLVDGDLLWSKDRVHGGAPFLRATPTDEQRRLLTAFIERVVAQEIPLPAEYYWYCDAYELDVSIDGGFVQGYLENRRESRHGERILWNELQSLMTSTIPKTGQPQLDELPVAERLASHCRYGRH